MAASAGPDDKTQRDPRQHVFLAAEISGFDRSAPTKHRIKDLSVTGARIDRASKLVVGSTVLVSVGILETIGATVVWVQDDIAGLRFAQPIDPAAARSKTIVSAPGQSNPGPKPTPVEEPRASAGWIGAMRNRHL